MGYGIWDIWDIGYQIPYLATAGKNWYSEKIGIDF
jgi:hypothetical protein